MDTANFGNNRWKIVYGKKNINEVAVNRIYAAVAEFCEYILTATSCSLLSEKDKQDNNLIIVGTNDDNCLIQEFVKAGVIILPEDIQSYVIKVLNNYFGEKQIIVIASSGSEGLLHGAVDFRNKFIPQIRYTESHNNYYINPFQYKISEKEIISTPKVLERAIWTWGHTITDYRMFIDNMATLKLNMLVIWNDFAPINAKEIVKYAHSRYIKIIWGYSWGWGVDIDLSDSSELERISDEAVEKYKNEYENLGGDGIYFQSFTETNNENQNGVIIAEAVTNWVNIISSRLLTEYPNLNIQFGLHATSVKTKLEYLKAINPAITIVWEDAGAFPYAYLPKHINDYDKTLELTKEISVLRGKNDKFGAVLKGLTALNWLKFEHQKAPYIMGESTNTYRAKCESDKSSLWKYIQAYWIRNIEYLRKLVKEVVEIKDGKLNLQALIEDGVFERRIWYPAALFAEVLWDPNVSEKDLLCNTALFPDVIMSNELL